jgi:hypothetical protein
MTNYLYGDRKNWITGVPTYEKVRVENIYPGIDAVYYGNQNGFEYDLIVKPGISPNLIDIAFDSGAQLAVDESGDLVVSLSDHEFRQSKPLIYQARKDGRSFVDGHYVLTNSHVGFEIGKYDPTEPLIIDPQLEFSILGAGAFANGTALDSEGNVYICGASEKSQGFSNAFVEKFNSTGTSLIYSNFFGANTTSNEVANAIAVDTSGNAYVTGYTDGGSPDFPFPTVNPIQATGFKDAFVTKFSPTGKMIYSTLLGGADIDIGRAIAVDNLGNIYVAGKTQSTDFPTFKPFQPSLGGKTGKPDAFLTVVNPQGSGFVYSTYIGGADTDYATGIAVDATGNAYVSGTTDSADFPASVALSPSRGREDGFVFKMNASGTVLRYSIFLGGSGSDTATGIALDSSGSSYVTGTTSSADFPTAGALQAALSGGSDAFVTKIDPTGSALVYSTYLGGTHNETGAAIVVNGTNAHVVGQTFSLDFPQVRSLQGFTGGSDAFVAELSTDGSSLIYSTFLGGSAGCCHNRSANTYAAARSVAGDGIKNIVVAGDTNSSDFPTTATPIGGCCRGTSFFNSSAPFVAKLGPDLTSTTWTRVEQDSSPVQYTGPWYTNSNPNHSGSTAVLTILGSSSFSFSGTGARWISYGDQWSGIANVYVDGVFQGAVDTYSRLAKYQVVQYTITGLPSGQHTLDVRGTGQHNASASSSWIWVDAFEYTTADVNSASSGTVMWTRLDDNDPSVQFSGDWAVNSNPNDTAGSAHLTLLHSVTFTFSGTGARWIGVRDQWSGIANVYVDGVPKGSVDTYSATTTYQAVQYTITGLAPGTHTLKIQATGQQVGQAQSAWIWVDGFDFTTSGGTK